MSNKEKDHEVKDTSRAKIKNFKSRKEKKRKKSEPRFSSMPKHVETVKYPGGCRFHG